MKISRNQRRSNKRQKVTEYQETKKVTKPRYKSRTRHTYQVKSSQVSKIPRLCNHSKAPKLNFEAVLRSTLRAFETISISEHTSLLKPLKPQKLVLFFSFLPHSSLRLSHLQPPETGHTSDIHAPKAQSRKYPDPSTSINPNHFLIFFPNFALVHMEPPRRP